LFGFSTTVILNLFLNQPGMYTLHLIVLACRANFPLCSIEIETYFYDWFWNFNVANTSVTWSSHNKILYVDYM